MHAILFAGGVGQRLWPISRRNTPKQFSPIIGDKSSFQLCVERLLSFLEPSQIYISTNQRYATILKHQAPFIPEENFILEPARRDLAPAVAYALFRLKHKGLSGPVLFQWTDNYVQGTNELLKAIKTATTLILEDNDRLIFIGEIPRFPNENIGWIRHSEEVGCIDGLPYYKFDSMKYRPDLQQCKQMFESGMYVWNAGYFVSSIEFLISQFRRFGPEITSILDEIVSCIGTEQEEARLKQLYPTIPVLHFDNVILERLDPERAFLIKSDLKWSDPGSLYALKEALQTSKDANVTQGKVVELRTEDSLIYNGENGKVIAVMGMEGVIIVNTDDALLVLPKHAVTHMPSLLKKLEEEGFNAVL